MSRKMLITLLLITAVILGTFSSVFAQDSLTIWADDTRAPILEELGADFEAEFGIAVEVVELGFGDIRDQMKTAAPAGEGPDIIIGAHDWLGELVINALLEPIELGEQAEDFFQPALDAFTYEGTLYAVPYATENIAFVYNPELVPEAPTTWEEVYEISQELVANGDAEYGFVRQSGDGYHFYPIMTAFGGYVFGENEDGTWDPSDLGFDNEGALESGDFYAQFVEEGLAPSSVDYDVMHSLFENEQAAMIVTGPWAIPRIEESSVPFEVTGLPEGPAGPSQPFLGAQGFMISSFSDNTLLAEAFLLDFVATEEAMQALFEADPRPSAFLPVLENIEDENIQGFIDAGTNAVAMPNIPEMSSVWTAWENALQLISSGELGGSEAFSDAATQIRNLLSGEESTDSDS